MPVINPYFIHLNAWTSSAIIVTWCHVLIAVRWTPTLSNPCPSAMPVCRYVRCRCGHSMRPPIRSQFRRHLINYLTWIWVCCGVNWPAFVWMSSVVCKWLVHGRFSARTYTKKTLVLFVMLLHFISHLCLLGSRYCILLDILFTYRVKFNFTELF